MYPTASFTKTRPVGDELFDAEGQTDGHDEVNSHFSQFCERAYNKAIHTPVIVRRKQEQTIEGDGERDAESHTC
jgi:hypothetical protein